MNSRRVATLLIIVVVLLAGCSSIGFDDSDSNTPTESAPISQTTSTPTATPTQTTFVKTPPQPITTTTPEEWTPPKTPKDPETKKRVEIKSGELVNKQRSSSGSGYSGFDIQVTANTSWQRIDPTPDVAGEPYFYVEINGEPIVREEVGMHKDNVYEITIRDGALEQFDSGELAVTVWLYDEDHDFDDVYGVWEGTINYNGG